MGDRKATAAAKGGKNRKASFDGAKLDFGSDPSVVQKGKTVTLTNLTLTPAENALLRSKFPDAVIDAAESEKAGPSSIVFAFKSKKQALEAFRLMESDDSPFPSTIQVGTCYSCDEMILG